MYSSTNRRMMSLWYTTPASRDWGTLWSSCHPVTTSDKSTSQFLYHRLNWMTPLWRRPKAQVCTVQESDNQKFCSPMPISPGAQNLYYHVYYYKQYMLIHTLRQNANNAPQKGRLYNYNQNFDCNLSLTVCLWRVPKALSTHVQGVNGPKEIANV